MGLLIAAPLFVALLGFAASPVELGLFRPPKTDAHYQNGIGRPNFYSLFHL